MKTIKDIDVEGKKVLVRVGYDVPIKEGKVMDDTRILKSLPTLKYLKEKGAKITLMFHLGRPKGVDDSLRTDPVAERLKEITGWKVKKVDDCIGDTVRKAVEEQNDEIIVLENLRFYREEKANDEGFAKKLAEPFDIYVNEAFSVCHREHASMVGVPKFIPGVIGLHVKEELDKLSYALNPEHPFVVIMGGAKISDKLSLIRTFIDKAEYVLLGGAMIFTFYKAQGFEVGKSLWEEDMVKEAEELLKNKKIILPVDVVVAKEKSNDVPFKTVDARGIGKDDYGLDIGDKSIERFKEVLRFAKTIVWNGPMGLFELDNFSKGTIELAKYLADIDGKVIVGGGDSVSAINKTGLQGKFYHISSGGGASLTVLQGKELVALRALE